MDAAKRLTPQSAGLDPARMPRHVAIIMDGNGRWARNRGLDRSEGHYRGVDSVRSVTRAASDLGVGYLTLYAFSTENWQRPKKEVDILMHLIGMAIENETPELDTNNVRLKLVGGIDDLPDEARERLERSYERLKGNTGLTLSLCLNYSARTELTKAMRRMAVEARDGSLDPAKISPDTIASYLETAPAPDPDLLIRTGGEHRVSNFLLWQISYAELLFTPTLWPDFGPDEFVEALRQYQSRERRYGLTGDQVKNNNLTS